MPFTRNGHNWRDRFPLITEAALRNRNSSFVIDGEAVLLGVDGRSDFNGLHSRRHDADLLFYAFDMLVSDGEDLRKLPLTMRKSNLSRLLARRVDGIFLSDFEQGEIGPDLSDMPAAWAGGHGFETSQTGHIARLDRSPLGEGQIDGPIRLSAGAGRRLWLMRRRGGVRQESAIRWSYRPRCLRRPFLAGGSARRILCHRFRGPAAARGALFDVR